MLKNVLLIDDDPDEGELFRDVVAEIDPAISFDIALSGESALTSLAAGKVKPDIIFLDINMPEMDGWECLKWLKAMPACGNIPVYMYTTSKKDMDHKRAHEMGAVALITKYDNYRKFRDGLASILSGGIAYFTRINRRSRKSFEQLLFKIVFGLLTGSGLVFRHPDRIRSTSKWLNGKSCLSV